MTERSIPRGLRLKYLEIMREVAADVDRRIVGNLLADEWAEIHGRRLLLVLDHILAQATRRPGQPLRVLNAGGLGGGQFDFCLLRCLRMAVPEMGIRWVAMEHPQAPHLQSPVFTEYVRSLGLEIRLIDIACPERVATLENRGPYDVICLTEIIEHLDFTVTVRWLLKLREWLEAGGILIITTPNLCRLVNRMRMMLGNGDLGYWGDGPDDVRRGRLGHSAYWDIKRLSRILRCCGYHVVRAKTFNQVHAMGAGMLARQIVEGVAQVALWILPRSGTNVLIVATGSETANGKGTGATET